jgi:hypothetical protein
MISEWPDWFSYIFIGFVLFVCIVLVSGSWQQNKLARRAEHWPIVDAIVVERLFLSADPTTYRYKVRYDFNGAEYISEAENFFDKSNTDKYVGDTILIRVDPSNPASCVLYS